MESILTQFLILGSSGGKIMNLIVFPLIGVEMAEVFSMGGLCNYVKGYVGFLMC